MGKREKGRLGEREIWEFRILGFQEQGKRGKMEREIGKRGNQRKGKLGKGEIVKREIVEKGKWKKCVK